MIGTIKGLIISNGYMQTSKFSEIAKMYQDAAIKLGIKIEEVMTNEISYGVIQNSTRIHIDKIRKNEMELLDFVLFLDKDIRLAKAFEMMGIRVFNSSEVIEICDDKSRTFQLLADHDIPMPATIIAPLVYSGTYKGDDVAYIDILENQLGYPMIVKESFGSFGHQVYKVDTREELITKRKEIAEKPHIYQKYVKSSHGRDVRINVVGNKVVASMLRTSESDFRANLTNGGSMQVFERKEAFETLAIKVCKILQADFAGVDILFGEDGEPILCEVNSNAHIKNIYMCTGINVAEEIMRYIMDEIRGGSRDEKGMDCLLRERFD